MKDTLLLIQTNTNDDDVNVLEVEHLIKSLRAEGKKFEYEIFQDVPGGHSFNRMDTKVAHEVRVGIYKFLCFIPVACKHICCKCFYRININKNQNT
jgi:dienelactone hydrolase